MCVVVFAHRELERSVRHLTWPFSSSVVFPSGEWHAQVPIPDGSRSLATAWAGVEGPLGWLPRGRRSLTGCPPPRRSGDRGTLRGAEIRSEAGRKSCYH